MAKPYNMTTTHSAYVITTETTMVRLPSEGRRWDPKNAWFYEDITFDLETLMMSQGVEIEDRIPPNV